MPLRGGRMQDQFCIVEGPGLEHFGPLTHFRPVFDLRCGVMTLREKLLAHYAPTQVTVQLREYLAEMSRSRGGALVNGWQAADTLVLDGRLVGDPELPRQIPAD